MIPIVWRPSVVVRRSSFTLLIFFSGTANPIKAKFYVEPLWIGETKVSSRHLGHMTKMADMPIYGKTLQNLLLWNRRADFHETWYIASGSLPIIVCSNDDPEVTLTYFTARSNLAT